MLKKIVVLAHQLRHAIAVRRLSLHKLWTAQLAALLLPLAAVLKLHLLLQLHFLVKSSM
jgi:hypothetical protein